MELKLLKVFNTLWLWGYFKDLIILLKGHKLRCVTWPFCQPWNQGRLLLVEKTLESKDQLCVSLKLLSCTELLCYAQNTHLPSFGTQQSTLLLRTTCDSLCHSLHSSNFHNVWSGPPKMTTKDN